MTAKVAWQQAVVSANILIMDQVVNPKLVLSTVAKSAMAMFVTRILTVLTVTSHGMVANAGGHTLGMHASLPTVLKRLNSL